MFIREIELLNEKGKNNNYSLRNINFDLEICMPFSENGHDS